jgi:hypothetical protein
LIIIKQNDLILPLGFIKIRNILKYHLYNLLSTYLLIITINRYVLVI